MINNRTRILVSFLSVTAFATSWEILSGLEIVNPLLFPPPSKIYTAFLEWWDESLLTDFIFSFKRMGLGLLIGGVSGIAIGLLTGRLKLINWILGPLLQFLRALPPVAIIPLVIIWLGITDLSKVFSISFAVMMPVWINTHLGSQNVPNEYIWNAKVLKLPVSKLLFGVIIPSTLLPIFSGLRIAIALAFIMVYVSEIAGASEGLGYQISVNHLAYRIDRMMASLVFLGICAALTDGIFTYMVFKVFPWLKVKDKN